MLVDPASGDGTPLTDAAFTPLVLSEADGNNPAKIVALGQPSESIFKTYHTALLSATVPGDTLCTPLAMSGAQTTPLDLTDLGSSARVQTGFKLTRLAARFDIVNNAETSRFTIQSISMGNGRRGATFFPIRIYGILRKYSLHFRKELFAEDQLFNTEYLRYVRTAVSIPDIGYYYLQNSQSVSHSRVTTADILSLRRRVMLLYRDIYTELGIYPETRAAILRSPFGENEFTLPPLDTPQMHCCKL